MSTLPREGVIAGSVGEQCRHINVRVVAMVKTLKGVKSKKLGDMNRQSGAMIRLIGRFMISVLTLTLVACSSDDADAPSNRAVIFESIGLNGRIVYRIWPIQGDLIAATDRGLHRFRQGQGWTLLGSAQWRILDWVVLSDGRWLISTADGGDYEPITHYEMFESQNQGVSWSPVAHDFGGVEVGQPSDDRPYRLLRNGDDVYATGADVLAQSSDGGRHWSLLSGVWQGFATGLRALALAPDGRSLWYGGQGGFENLVLQRFDLVEGESLPLGDLSLLLPAPSVVKGIDFDRRDSRRVFISGEGGIVQSRDEGQTWQGLLLNTESRFYFGIQTDARAAGTLYTAGWAEQPDEPQPLVLEISTNDGLSWQRYRHPSSSLWGGVYSMTSRLENGETVLYLGLFKGGVMRVTFDSASSRE